MESLKVKYLDAKTISGILKQIGKKDSSIAYNCKVSRTSSSIYFRLYSKDTEAFVSRRISDHPSSSDIVTLIVGPSTKYKHVENFILKAVKQLGRRRRAILWQHVKEEQMKNEESNNKTSCNQTTGEQEETVNTDSSLSILRHREADVSRRSTIDK